MAQRQLHLTVHLQVSDPDVEVVFHVVRRAPNLSHLLIQIAAKATSLNEIELLSSSRKRLCVVARKACCVILRQEDKMLLPEIASRMKYADHSSVIYHIRKHEDSLIYDDLYHDTYHTILNNYKQQFQNG